MYISRECTIHALRDDVNCSKIAYSVLELYTEICELRKRTNSRFPVGKLNYDLNANGEAIDLACSSTARSRIGGSEPFQREKLGKGSYLPSMHKMGFVPNLTYMAIFMHS